MTREVWQEYDCPQGIDFDLYGDSLVYRGAAIQCAGCGKTHIAGGDVEVQTYLNNGEVSFPLLPERAQELAALVNGI